MTFPRKLADSPAHSSGSNRTYPGDEEKKVYYDEGIFIGYRWFDKEKIDPLFPFGFGMSYTTFEYGSIHLDKGSIIHTDGTFNVELDVVNTGERSGAEVVQVYSRDIQASVERPQKELVGFGKIRLTPGEKRTASITIRAEDLAFYDIHKHEWVVEPGDFEILVGRSAQDILAKAMISFT